MSSNNFSNFSPDWNFDPFGSSNQTNQQQQNSQQNDFTFPAFPETTNQNEKQQQQQKKTVVFAEDEITASGTSKQSANLFGSDAFPSPIENKSANNKSIDSLLNDDKSFGEFSPLHESQSFDSISPIASADDLTIPTEKSKSIADIRKITTLDQSTEFSGMNLTPKGSTEVFSFDLGNSSISDSKIANSDFSFPDSTFAPLDDSSSKTSTEASSLLQDNSSSKQNDINFNSFPDFNGFDSTPSNTSQQPQNFNTNDNRSANSNETQDKKPDNQQNQQNNSTDFGGFAFEPSPNFNTNSTPQQTTSNNDFNFDNFGAAFDNIDKPKQNSKDVTFGDFGFGLTENNDKNDLKPGSTNSSIQSFSTFNEESSKPSLNASSNPFAPFDDQIKSKSSSTDFAPFDNASFPSFDNNDNNKKSSQDIGFGSFGFESDKKDTNDAVFGSFNEKPNNEATNKQSSKPSSNQSFPSSDSTSHSPKSTDVFSAFRPPSNNGFPSFDNIHTNNLQ